MAKQRWMGAIVGLAMLLGGSAARAQAPVDLSKFATPRQTLKTFYFSMLAYDFRTALIEDAVACLEPGPTGRRDFAELARLAVELDEILREICLTVSEVSDKPGGESAVAYEADGFVIRFVRQADGRWCFSEATVANIPAMYRLALARHRDYQSLRAGLRKDFTDPAAALRFFLIEAMSGDYYAAARALDLSRVPADQRSDQGPLLAQQLMFTIQRQGWVYFQEIPKNPDGPPYTWHADRSGRIVLERVHQSDGKDAWMFSKNTVKNLKAMYETALSRPPDSRYIELGRVVPPLAPAAQGVQRPASVPAHLGSPRALLKAFFRAMSEAETNDRRLVAAAEFLDLDAVQARDRPALAVSLAPKLDAVLRKLEIDLTTVADSWNAPTQVLGREHGLHVELIRYRDGRWRFSRATVEQIPQLFDKLAAQKRSDQERSGHLETARDTMSTFLRAGNQGDDIRAARCLDLSHLNSSARGRIGPVLAFKLKYAIDRIGRVYPEEVPDEPEGPRYIFHSGDLGRIVIARKTDGPNKGRWMFTAETVERIEPMFLAALGRPVDESLRGTAYMARGEAIEETPGIWLRLHMPGWASRQARGLEIYQWVGLPLLVLLCWGTARLVLIVLSAVISRTLRQLGSALTASFVASKLWPLTGVVAASLFFRLLIWLDLPASWLDTLLPLEAIILAVPLGWFGCRAVDLLRAIHLNSELISPQNSLSDMIVPVCLRLLKGTILLLVMAHLVYQVGKGDLLVNFLTGLGAIGLAASLAAQDIVKSFYGTLLLVGERSFKIGDHIQVDGHEGVVEQVGFRSMQLRTPDGSLVTIPNSTIASASIDVRGALANRRHAATIALGKDMPVEQIASVRDRLHDWLRGHPAVNPETIDVSIGLHRDSGAELQVNLLLREANGADTASVRREINYAILRVVQQLEQTADRTPEWKAVG